MPFCGALLTRNSHSPGMPCFCLRGVSDLEQDTRTSRLRDLHRSVGQGHRPWQPIKLTALRPHATRRPRKGAERCRPPDRVGHRQSRFFSIRIPRTIIRSGEFSKPPTWKLMEQGSASIADHNRVTRSSIHCARRGMVGLGTPPRASTSGFNAASCRAVVTILRTRRPVCAENRSIIYMKQDERSSRKAPTPSCASGEKGMTRTDRAIEEPKVVGHREGPAPSPTTRIARFSA